jgi:hypothetical protein
MHVSLLLSLLPAVLAAPKAKRSEPAPLIVPRGDPADLIPGQYIVKLRDDSPFSVLDDAMRLFPNDADQIYNGTFNGFAAKLSESDVEALRDDINVGRYRFRPPASHGPFYDSLNDANQN